MQPLGNCNCETSSTVFFFQLVAVKQLDRNGMQGNREFLVEVLMLSLLHHPNLVSLIGYCADGDQRLLVYEYMSAGSLEDHLLGNNTCNHPIRSIIFSNSYLACCLTMVVGSCYKK